MVKLSTFSGVLRRDLLDVHAALGRADEGDAARGPVDQQREVELAGDVGAVLDVDAVDHLAGRPGLVGDERAAEHLLRLVGGLGDRLGDAHAALVAGGGLLELALAAAAGVDLRLDHPDRPVELAGGGLGLVGLQHHAAVGHRHAVLLQELLGLVFVNVHRRPSPAGAGRRTGLAAARVGRRYRGLQTNYEPASPARARKSASCDHMKIACDHKALARRVTGRDSAAAGDVEDRARRRRWRRRRPARGSPRPPPRRRRRGRAGRWRRSARPGRACRCARGSRWR